MHDVVVQGPSCVLSWKFECIINWYCWTIGEKVESVSCGDIWTVMDRKRMVVVDMVEIAIVDMRDE